MAVVKPSLAHTSRLPARQPVTTKDRKNEIVKWEGKPEKTRSGGRWKDEGDVEVREFREGNGAKAERKGEVKRMGKKEKEHTVEIIFSWHEYY